jgi:hypothetical protein
MKHSTTRWKWTTVVAAVVIATFVWQFRHTDTATLNAAETEGSPMMLAHNVFFSLNDPTPANRQKLVDACKKYLSNHPGTVFFAAGTVADFDRPVNDRDFDVGLHLVFKDHASHDAYQTAPLHEQFIAENKADWKKVRVFDSNVVGAK